MVLLACVWNSYSMNTYSKSLVCFVIFVGNFLTISWKNIDLCCLFLFFFSPPLDLSFFFSFQNAVLSPPSESKWAHNKSIEKLDFLRCCETLKRVFSFILFWFRAFICIFFPFLEDVSDTHVCVMNWQTKTIFLSRKMFYFFMFVISWETIVSNSSTKIYTF